MITSDLLDRALDGDGGSQCDSVHALVDLGTEVAAAFRAVRLSPDERQRLYARSLGMLAAAVTEHRAGWQRALRLRRSPPALVGGLAAAGVGAAAVAGWVLVHHRHTRPPLPA